ncbi:MAG TPA: hypothetical protein VEA36_01155 [Candidatus Paceibacterota bacterium]|nr:hypothetical protein [Candidatus Paceibacterota bacterium]
MAPGTTITFTATPQNGASGPYTWYDGSSNIIGSGATLQRQFNSDGSVRAEGGGVFSNYCSVDVVSASCQASGPLDITATPARIVAGTPTAISVSWTASGIDSACTVRILGPDTQIGSSAHNAASCSSSGGPVSGGSVSAQTTYRLQCGSLWKDAVVNVIPRYEEF